MAASIYDNDALENWKHFGGNEGVINSYVAKAGSSASLAPSAPVKTMATAAPVAGVPSMKTEAGVKQGATAAPLSLDAQKQWIDQNKPEEVSATYQGPEAMSMHWGGSLIGGSNTGIEDYGNWQSDRAKYNQAMAKWQDEYADWEARNKAQPQPAPQAAQPVAPEEPKQPVYGTPSTQQQNLGQSPYTAPTNPYAVPGQRSAPQPGTGQVQKPDKTLSKVNKRYEGVL